MSCMEDTHLGYNILCFIFYLFIQLVKIHVPAWVLVFKILEIKTFHLCSITHSKVRNMGSHFFMSDCRCCQDWRYRFLYIHNLRWRNGLLSCDNNSIPTSFKSRNLVTSQIILTSRYSWINPLEHGFWSAKSRSYWSMVTLSEW